MHFQAFSKLALLAGAFLIFSAHDLFIKMNAYFLQPGDTVELRLFNGTFDRSENTIARDRFADARITGPDGLRKPDTLAWFDRDATTVLRDRAGSPGTYLASVSIRPRMIELSAEDFNQYLRHDGVLDVLADREEKGLLNRPAREQYAKHVKALYQVGEPRTEHYAAVRGYPVEFVPMTNPYSLTTGDELEVQLLRNGAPLPRQLVYAGYAGHHAHNDKGEHTEAIQTRTDARGRARIKLSRKGEWYLRTIHMVESRQPGVDYESNWATLTFAVN